MRRTRHVVLPVRSWQYIGLLIVSLACLTLGLVSRDREGHSGSLAGPELTHQAPHEVDACPNLIPFVKNSIAEPEEATKPHNEHKIKLSESRASPISRKSVLSRSLSFDRLSRSGSQEIRERLSGNRDLRAVERLSRSRTRVSDDRSINRFRESRFRTSAQSRDIRKSFNPATRFSRSRDLFNGATDRRSASRSKPNFERRLADPLNSRLEDRRSTERRELNEIAQRQNRVDRSADRRDSLNLQRRTSDHRGRKSLPTERQVNRQESREVLAGRREHRDLSRNRVPNDRSEIRERRSLSVERRMSIEHRDAVRSDRREDRRDLLNRSAKFTRKDIDRNDNLDRRNRERSLENRRALHDRVANQERRSRFSVARNSRGDLIRSDDRQTLSRSMERSGFDDLNRNRLSRRSIKSVEFNTARSEERRLSVRSMERRENRIADRKSFNRAMPRLSSEDVRREGINRSQRTASRRDSRENAAVRENHRMTRSRYDVEEITSRERKERFARSSRLVERNSVDHREIARIRDSRDYDRRSREERRIALQRPREAERRTSEQRIPERRVLERQVALDSVRLDSRKLSERRIDGSPKSREGSRLTDQRLERNPESRISRGRLLEKRSALDSRKLERRIDDSSKSREGFKLADRRLERNFESRVSRGRILEKRSALDSRRLSDQRIDDSPKSREGSRLTDRRLERNPESRVSRGNILERRSTHDSRRSSERRIHDGSRSREKSRMQDRRVERNSELRNSISMLPMERRTNSITASLENQVLRSSETQREVRRLKERQVARSVENRPTEFRERESIRHLRQRSARNIEDSSRLSSLRRVHVPEQNRKQRRLSTERTLARTVDNERLSAKWERILQNARVERNVETRAKIVPNSMKDFEFFKYSMAYDIMKQAFVVALCTVYGLSLYNGKKSSIGNNIMQHAQRFVFW
ncbi:uncharacterized protein [Temnothorax longispinosus]|uniref:uncharacterized protein n=1 Tax=Temnothorax longispinosus TaxID=300112 RepID=UPI003A99C7F6